MIDQHTGHLILAPAVCVRPGDSLETVAALTLGESQDRLDMQTGWQWLFVRNVRVGQQYFVLHFGFYAHRLQLVSLVMSGERFGRLANWGNWSERAEVHRLEELKQWVSEELGHEGEFSWGSVTADYDPKNASSGITIRYR
jgi:hypothetical protein